MFTKQACKSSERFLFAQEYFADTAIAIWQTESRKRCKIEHQGVLYENYINWKRQANEIAVFTLYACADLKIPKKFDIIFELDNPKNFVNVEFILTQSIWEAWFPLNCIAKGHKHLCIFSFEKDIPDLLYQLHKDEEKFSTVPKGQKILGFCNSLDFEMIAQEIKTNKLSI